jgi:hypothetical protein
MNIHVGMTRFNPAELDSRRSKGQQHELFAREGWMIHYRVVHLQKEGFPRKIILDLVV